jgi:hypothetical protein
MYSINEIGPFVRGSMFQIMKKKKQKQKTIGVWKLYKKRGAR